MSRASPPKVDLRGRKSPLPVVKVAKVVKKIKPGTSAEFLIDDLRSLEDIQKWAERTGNKITRLEDQGGFWRVVVRKRL
ncbi:MAG: hypothetical protein DRO01_00430 [Thermoproteota archaeon]|nr:MAG: hypothetical protein DRO01_00430 [Candidatus Korarchaeota archaeon]